MNPFVILAFLVVGVGALFVITLILAIFAYMAWIAARVDEE